MSGPTTPEERRHFKRIQFDCETFVDSAADAPLPVKLLDISLKGALIERPSDWSAAEGDSVLLRIRLGGDDSEVRMEANIAHQDKDHVGFRCQHIDIDSAAHLRRIVELNLGDPELLNRELAALLE